MHHCHNIHSHDSTLCNPFSRATFIFIKTDFLLELLVLLFVFSTQCFLIISSTSIPAPKMVCSKCQLNSTSSLSTVDYSCVLLAAYHQKCIDPWLTKNKKTCPICKRKVIPGRNADSDSDMASSSDDEADETRPLLRQQDINAGEEGRLVLGGASIGGTFDNAGKLFTLIIIIIYFYFLL